MCYLLSYILFFQQDKVWHTKLGGNSPFSALGRGRHTFLTSIKWQKLSQCPTIPLEMRPDAMPLPHATWLSVSYSNKKYDTGKGWNINSF